MNADDMRLTDEEMRCPTHAPHAHDRHIADAATSKAAWALFGWLRDGPHGRDIIQATLDLEDALEAAGIPRPQEGRS